MEVSFEQKTKVTVKLYGEQYEMRMPLVNERSELLKVIESAKSQSELWDYQKEFISKLGLPVDVIESMEDEHFNELAKVFISPKKN